jgi:hypothetical protein
MSEDLKLMEDEARRRDQHEKVKNVVGNEVRAEMVKDAARVAPGEAEKAEKVGHDLKSKAISEVAGTERETSRARVYARVRQVTDFVFGVVYALIGLQILLELIGAREGAGFKHLMNTITAPLLGPFHGLVTDPSVGRFQFMSSYFVALIVYMLLHVAIRGLLRLLANRRTTV